MPTTTETLAARKSGTIQRTTAFDLNDADAVTPPLFLGGATELRASVVGTTGTHEEHVVALEGSLAPTGPWTDLETTIAGEDAAAIAAPPWLYVRARVATPEGAESTGCVAVYAR